MQFFPLVLVTGIGVSFILVRDKRATKKRKDWRDVSKETFSVSFSSKYEENLAPRNKEEMEFWRTC